MKIGITASEAERKRAEKPNSSRVLSERVKEERICYGLGSDPRRESESRAETGFFVKVAARVIGPGSGRLKNPVSRAIYRSAVMIYITSKDENRNHRL
jgi:hypothetical protein